MKAYRARRWPLGLALLLVAAACGGDDDDSSASSTTRPRSSSRSARAKAPLSILAWPGYAEDGSTRKDVDWVTPFEEETGCKASVKTFGTSDEAFQLFDDRPVRRRVSASGDATLRIVANGDAAPLNTDLLTNYADLAPFL